MSVLVNLNRTGLIRKSSYNAQPFDNLTEARLWVHSFVQWYNQEHHHSAIHFVTPMQRHQGEDRQILEQRKAVYEAAKQRHPERWSGSTRDWTPHAVVWLNPDQTVDEMSVLRDEAA